MRAATAELVLITVASLALTAVASAADLPARTSSKAAQYVPTPPCAWCGWYIGANGGAAWGGNTGSRGDFSPGFGAAVAAGLTPSSLDVKPTGGFGGGQFGYNWMMYNVLVGFEADLQGADISKTTTITPPAALNTLANVTGRDHIEWFGTARGRLGVTTGNVLFYGTGGLAFGGASSSATNTFIAGNDPTDVFAGSSSNTRFGWAAGAGLEWMFAPSWSLKAEYLHVDLGSSTVRLTESIDPADFVDYRFHHEFDSARIGVNYHFGTPVVAKY